MDTLQVVAQTWVETILTRGPAAIITLVAGWFIIRLLVSTVRRAMQLGRVDATITSLTIAVVRMAAWVVVLASTLKSLGLDEISLAVGGSITLVALAIATSASGTTADVIAGVFLVGDEDFRVGMRVTAAGVTGVIEAIDLRKTRVRDDEGRLMVIPNKNVEGAIWIVEERPPVK